jgi:hypothetical protein
MLHTAGCLECTQRIYTHTHACVDVHVPKCVLLFEVKSGGMLLVASRACSARDARVLFRSIVLCMWL